MSPADMIHIPMTKAFLCQDCAEVGNCPEQCPACASDALLSLAGVLNRDTQPIRESVMPPCPTLM